MRLLISFLISLLITLAVPLRGAAAEPAVAAESLVWHWDDRFSAEEKQMLTAWLQETHAAIERYAGPFPFPVHIHMEHHERGGEPVPWANTWRSGEQAIYFYVDTAFGLDEFIADWTAPHEFAHLYLPYLGRENAWFAEGFASYLQHSIMVEMGVIDASEARSRRDRKIQAAMADLENQDLPLPDNVDTLRAKRKYPTFYWGGAVYWERVDRQLINSGSSLQSVIGEFLLCCRLARRSVEDLTETLDELSNTQIFTRELALMRREPGCPQRMPVGPGEKGA